MAEVTEIEVRVGVTKNMGNYESARLDYSARQTLNGEHPGTQLDKLRKTLEVLVMTDVNKIGASK